MSHTTDTGEAAFESRLVAAIVLAAMAVVVGLAFLPRESVAADLGGYKDSGVPTDARSWTGVYGAGFVGGEIDTVTFSDTDFGLGPKGIFGGVRLGYDYLTPNGFLLGAFAEGSIADVSASAGDNTLRQDLRWGLGARVGRSFGQTLFYVPVSYVRSHAEGDGFDWSKDLNGWRVGAGVEQQLGGGWGFMVEAGSTWYGDIGTGIDGVNASTQSVDGRLGIVKRF